MRLPATFCLLVVLCSALPAFAATFSLDGIRFEAPAALEQIDGGPRPAGTPFLRLRSGAETDAFSETIEVMSGPEDARLTREGFAEFALTPVQRFCGEHQVLRNDRHSVGGADVVGVGYVCLRHSRQPQFSRQAVRAVAVFHEGRVTMFMYVRRWRGSHADDQLTPEQWMAPTDALIASIAPCSGP
ncbi:MAG: hypothetical protein ACREH4_02245, partial [Vitreimonas sp.]